MQTLILPKRDGMANKRTKEEYEAAIISSYSIAGACRQLGIKPSGGNYRIIHNAIKEYSQIPSISLDKGGTRIYNSSHSKKNQ